MILEDGIYVRIVELENGPNPLPLKNGFETDMYYRAIGMYNASESSEAFFILVNKRDEVWFISNRHLRVVGIFKDRSDVSFKMN